MKFYIRLPSIYISTSKIMKVIKITHYNYTTYFCNVNICNLSQVSTRFTFLTTGFKLTTEGSFPLTTGENTLLGGFKSAPLPTAADFQTVHKASKGFRQHSTCRNPFVFNGFPNILFMPFVSNKRFTFP